MKHLKPRYYGYAGKGTYANICKCTDCELTGMYEDLHPANACPDCGGKVKESGSAKWDGQLWLTSKQQNKIKIEQELIGTADIESSSWILVFIWLVTLGKFGSTFKKVNKVAVLHKAHQDINCRCSFKPIHLNDNKAPKDIDRR